MLAQDAVPAGSMARFVGVLGRLRSRLAPLLAPPEFTSARQITWHGAAAGEPAPVASISHPNCPAEGPAISTAQPAPARLLAAWGWSLGCLACCTPLPAAGCMPAPWRCAGSSPDWDGNALRWQVHGAAYMGCCVTHPDGRATFLAFNGHPHAVGGHLPPLPT